MRILFILLCVYFTGCGMSLPHNLRHPTDDSNSVIAIAIDKKSPTSFFGGGETNVFFIKLKENSEDLTSGKIIQSNFYLNDYVFLINAEPGRYAAVASYSLDGERSYKTYFDSNLIRSTINDVKGGAVVFLGYFKLKTRGTVFRSPLKEDIQKYFSRTTKDEIPLKGYVYSGSLKSKILSKKIEEDFLRETHDAFEETGWQTIIETRMNELGIKKIEKEENKDKNKSMKEEEEDIIPPI